MFKSGTRLSLFSGRIAGSQSPCRSLYMLRTLSPLGNKEAVYHLMKKQPMLHRMTDKQASGYRLSLRYVSVSYWRGATEVCMIITYPISTHPLYNGCSPKNVAYIKCAGKCLDDSQCFFCERQVKLPSLNTSAQAMQRVVTANMFSRCKRYLRGVVMIRIASLHQRSWKRFHL